MMKTSAAPEHLPPPDYTTARLDPRQQFIPKDFYRDVVRMASSPLHVNPTVHTCTAFKGTGNSYELQYLF